MKSSFLNQLIRPFYSPFHRGLVACVSSLQHLLMKAAVAVSLKLCLFTARVLLGSTASARQQASQSF